VKFFFPINLLRILRALPNVGKSNLTKTLWKYVHACGRKLFHKINPSGKIGAALIWSAGAQLPLRQFLSIFSLDIRIN
jgi:hypothetical protein